MQVDEYQLSQVLWLHVTGRSGRAAAGVGEMRGKRKSWSLSLDDLVKADVDSLIASADGDIETLKSLSAIAKRLHDGAEANIQKINGEAAANVAKVMLAENECGMCKDEDGVDTPVSCPKIGHCKKCNLAVCEEHSYSCTDCGDFFCKWCVEDECRNCSKEMCDDCVNVPERCEAHLSWCATCVGEIYISGLDEEGCRMCDRARDECERSLPTFSFYAVPG